MYENIISIDRASSESLQTQIRRQMAIAILGRQFPIHHPLPSIRKLAADLKVSVTTVTLAYEALKSDGFVLGKGRSGFFVNPDVLAAENSGYEARTGSGAVEETASKVDFDTLFGERSFDLDRVVKPADALLRYRYPFICGLVDPSLFPITSWRECLRDSVNAIELRNWAADFSDIDDELLVEKLIQRCLFRRGINAHPSEVLVTIGGQMALYLAIKVLHRRGESIGIEDPGYPDIVNIAQLERLEIERLPIDSSGVIVDGIGAHLKSVFVTPSHQFPTNVTMPMERRNELLARTSRNGTFVIEDDYEAEISFNKTPPPALKSMDKNGNVIYVGSLTKSLMPGLRIGYLVADKAFVREARALRHHILRHPPVNNQRTVALFLQRGYFDRHVKRMTDVYRERCDVMFHELERHFPGHSTRPVYGGGSIWFRLPEGIDSHQLQEAVKRKGAVFEVVGNAFSDTRLNHSYIRLGFSLIDVAAIPAGIGVIAAAIHELATNSTPL
ncbi:transcriptional regulator [Leisingera sp. ANG-M1]|uniref:MocR-like pyridoxine biosynthesis transcription factor PdxR n=1 Tax=Leisingera sp. ANG-M1 TaxID=1577895 RepID=UPI00057CA5C9|nr:PLP-dependent aminotransferase family protein [Leisingera sp. ANG-M1]KIC07694.1 transcriptional regulator [Leisingera sp. ANG-M1]